MTRPIWILLALGIWATSHTGWAQQTRGVLFPSVSPPAPGQAGWPPAGQQPPSGSGTVPLNPFASAQGFVNRPPATIGSGTSVLRGRPHANYTPPPAISPYMNLFRGDDDRGMVNNYYTLVKPELDQRSYNQQTQRQIQSIQAATSLQSQQINRLNQQTSPQLDQFKNPQQYYPSYLTPGR